VEPDVMTLAKGIASGVPLAACLSKEHCSVLAPGDHGSTYGGNPLATRAGYEVVRYIIQNNIPAKVAGDGRYLEQRLHGLEDRLDLVTGIRGTGLIWALDLSQEVAEQVVLRCLEEGLIVNNVRPNRIRLLPPLITSREDLDQGIDILERVLRELGGGGAK
jgi:acetylornithine/succinyldiaminopimelate/putrescine aminotransferase